MLEPAVERAATRGAIGATRARSRIFFVRTPGVRVFELAERVRGRAEGGAKRVANVGDGGGGESTRTTAGRRVSRDVRHGVDARSGPNLKHAERVRRKVDDAASRRRRGKRQSGRRAERAKRGDFRRDELGTILGRFVDPRWENGENVRRRAIVLDGESVREEERFG